jgi:hypothetical protein
MGTLVLLDLMGGAALLLWGLHMVQSGVMRAFGPDLPPEPNAVELRPAARDCGQQRCQRHAVGS